MTTTHPLPQPSLPSRIRGSLLGLACVDALGAPLEFTTRGSYTESAGQPLKELIDNPNFDLPPGHWTDDTSMTLCLAESLVACDGRMDVLDQVRRYIRWYRQGYLSSAPSRGCFDIGNATRMALTIWEAELDHPHRHQRHQPHSLPEDGDRDDDGEEAKKATAKRASVAQRKINQSLDRKAQCGNGALMRCAPITLVYHDPDRHSAAEILDLARRSAEVTHPYPVNGEACGVYCLLLRAALSSTTVATKEHLAALLAAHEWQNESLRTRFAKYRPGTLYSPPPSSPTSPPVSASTAASILQPWHATPAHQISSSGYVVDTLEAALWAFFTTATFEEGAVKVVNLGNDADTVGAVYGGLAGGFYGLEDVPSRWLTGLQRREEVLQGVVEGVVRLVCGDGGDDDGKDDGDGLGKGT